MSLTANREQKIVSLSLALALVTSVFGLAALASGVEEQQSVAEKANVQQSNAQQSSSPQSSSQALAQASNPPSNAATVAGAASPSNLKERPKRGLLPDITIEKISASDKELAEQLEIWDMLCELHRHENPPTEERKELLRTKIRETIMESYLDAMSVQSEANREHGLLDALRERVIERRDRSVDTNNATNFIASGTLNTVGSVLGFTNKLPPFPGNFNQMLSGVVSTGMSTYALKQASGGKTRGQGSPTLIAELFGRPTDSRTEIPESVWRFLHGHSLDKPEKLRVQVLEEEWIEHKHLEPHGSAREKMKIDLVCGVSMSKKAMTVDDLNDQISMISELGGMVARMTRHLRDLLRLIDTDISD